jgi:hypothetical protein
VPECTTCRRARRARADVDDPVGGADGVLVVLDDDERVAEVAQRDERLDERRLSRWCRPMRRLVEHVEHAVEPEPICVASRMRCASPPESVAAAREVR